MKITLDQAVSEKEKQHLDKTRNARHTDTVSAGNTNFASMVGVQEGMQDIPGMGGEKGKSLIELQQEAANANTAVQQDYMTVMSNTLSAEDYAKLQEEGFDLGSMEPDEVVTIVDKIKAELARSGQNIVGYTDDIDMETLAAALGSTVLAKAVADSFRAADVPLTKENLSAISQAWAMSTQLQPVTDGSRQYLIDNEMEAEIWDLYLAQSSGAGKSGNAPRYYAEDVRGYYTQSAGGKYTQQSGELLAQIDKIIEQSGSEVNDESRKNASWLLDRGLPLTVENLNRLTELQKLELPVTEERFAEAAAAAVSEGKSPVHASLAGKEQNLYEKAAEVADYYHSREFWEANVGDITARRQLEEVRLRMTAEVNVKLLKRGFAIDTAPMEELIEALKMAERQVADKYFPKDAESVEKYHSYHKANTVASQLPGLPADLLGSFAQGQGNASLEEFHRKGVALQEVYAKAQKSYETLMTTPRSDLGDSIEKAFGNVDNILKGLKMEITDENRRAVRILGYNSMEMTIENLEAVKQADRQVQGVIEKLTPAATLKMIRDGINPLEKSFGELEKYFDELPPEYKSEAESYSRFLYGLERNEEITPEERESYIGIYRLVRQIERADGAAVGALVNSQAELHFSNLLSAVRSGKLKNVDVRVSDEISAVANKARKGESISSQIAKAFAKTADKIVKAVSSSKKATEEYNKAELEEMRKAVASANEDNVSMLERGELPANADNLIAAQALNQGAENIFEAGDKHRKVENKKQPERSKPAEAPAPAKSAQSAENVQKPKAEAPVIEVTDSASLWRILDSKDSFAQRYEDFAKEALEAVETATFTEADTSLDVRNMQLNHKQLTVASALAKQEEFYLPMYVGDVLTNVHLTLDGKQSEKGTVTISVSLTQEEHIQARLYLQNNTVFGIFIGGAQNEVMKTQEVADIFKKEAANNWSVGNITVVPSGGVMPAHIRNGEHVPTDSAELYRVAKVFLQSIRYSTHSE